jgi:hypothetical protein
MIVILNRISNLPARLHTCADPLLNNLDTNINFTTIRATICSCFDRIELYHLCSRWICGKHVLQKDPSNITRIVVSISRHNHVYTQQLLHRPRNTSCINYNTKMESGHNAATRPRTFLVYSYSAKLFRGSCNPIQASILHTWHALSIPCPSGSVVASLHVTVPV